MLGADTENAGYVFAALVIRKLPVKIRDNLNRAVNIEKWDLPELRKALETEIEHLRNSEPDIKWEGKNASEKEKRGKSNVNKPKGVHSGSVASLNVTSSDRKSICQFCKEEHRVFDCQQYVSVHDRRKRAAELQLCFNCLREGYRGFKCNNVRRCKHCKGKHHSVLCVKPDGLSNDKDNDSASGIGKDNDSASATALGVHVKQSSHVRSTLLPTAVAPILLKNGETSNSRCLFDQGSQGSFVLKELVDRLKIRKIGKSLKTVDSFNQSGQREEYEIVEFTIKTFDGPVFVQAMVVNFLPSRISMSGRSDLVDKLKLKGFILADSSNKEIFSDVEIIIGCDQYYKFVYCQPIMDDIYAVPSRLGSLVVGNISNNCQEKDNNNFAGSITACRITVEDPSVTDTLDVECLWKTDLIGISDKEDVSHDLVLINFEKSVRYESGRYTVRLPWIDNHPPLPDNYSLAVGRLRSLVKRLKQTPTLFRHYDDIINDQLSRGFIELVDDNTVSSPDAIIHYLSHHCVRKGSPTTPIRVVYDCSAKANPSLPSLNDCLYRGPCLLEDLGKMLLKFRLREFACVSDISKAFLQINIDVDDRDATRFLWLENVNNPEGKYLVYRFKVVLFGTSASQFLMCAVIRHHLNRYGSHVGEVIGKGLYADNVQATADSEKEIVDFYEKSRRIMNEAGFTLQQWAYNSDRLNNLAHENKDAANDIVRVSFLGFVWNTADDNLEYKRNFERWDGNLAKRKVLRISAKIFDPLGWLMPVTIRTRLFLQELWRAKVGWDEELRENFRAVWDKLYADLECVSECKFPRQIQLSVNTEIHAFSDASMRAYGAVLFAVTNDRVDLIVAKARVTPIKAPSLPQLELLAATLSARLIPYIISSYEPILNNVTVYCWSDSQIVLHWISSLKRLKSCIQKRVDEIKSLIPDATWN